MSFKHAFAAILVVVAFSPSFTKAEIVVTISEVGSDLVFSYDAGTVNTSGLARSFAGGGNNRLFYGSNNWIGGGGGSGNAWRFYSGVLVTKSSGWTNGNGGSSAWSSTSGIGGLLGSENLFGSGPNITLLDVAGPAVSGVNFMPAFSGSITGASFASTGFTDNEFIEYSWGADKVRFQTSSVPEPTSFALFGLVVFGMARRQRQI